MRALLVPIALVSFAAAAAGQVPAGTPEVNLDAPGALDRIEKQDPALYKRLVGVIAAAEVQPCEHLPKIIETQYRGELSSCAAYNILTSFPPKIHMSFVLDGTLYVSNVRQPNLVGRITPAIEQAKPAVDAR